MITTSLLEDPVFEGVGRFIHKILHKGWSSSCRKHISYEDYFQEFVVLWLSRKHKYDPARGKQTTFAAIVAQNYVRGQIKKLGRSSHAQTRRLADAQGELPGQLEFTEEEEAVILAYGNRDSRSKQRIIGHLCAETQINPRDMMTTLESIQTKVRIRNASKTASLEY